MGMFFIPFYFPLAVYIIFCLFSTFCYRCTILPFFVSPYFMFSDALKNRYILYTLCSLIASYERKRYHFRSLSLDFFLHHSFIALNDQNRFLQSLSTFFDAVDLGFAFSDYLNVRLILSLFIRLTGSYIPNIFIYVYYLFVA